MDPILVYRIIVPGLIPVNSFPALVTWPVVSIVISSFGLNPNATSFDKNVSAVKGADNPDIAVDWYTDFISSTLYDVTFLIVLDKSSIPLINICSPSINLPEVCLNVMDVEFPPENTA